MLSVTHFCCYLIRICTLSLGSIMLLARKYWVTKRPVSILEKQPKSMPDVVLLNIHIFYVITTAFGVSFSPICFHCQLKRPWRDWHAEERKQVRGREGRREGDRHGYDSILFDSIQLSLSKFWSWLNSWLTMSFQELIQINSRLKMAFWNSIQIDPSNDIPECWFKSTHDSKRFPEFWFNSTYD